MSIDAMALDIETGVARPGAGPPARSAGVTRIASLLLLAVAIIAIRLGGPSDLMDNEQQLQSAYVMDVRVNHHWVCQKDETGSITSKPPLYTWLAVLANLPLTRPSDLAMRLPSAAATIGVTLLVFHLGSRLGNLAGFLAALSYLLSYLTARSAGLARMDGILALNAALCAWAALHAWETRRGWIWFWLACAAATLAKTPLVAWMGAAGLLAALGSSRSPSEGKPRRVWPAHLVGITLFLLLTAGWLALSIKAMGRPVYEKLIVGELVDKAVTPHDGAWPLMHFYQPPLMFLTRFAPWSIFTFMAVWRVLRGQRRRVEPMAQNDPHPNPPPEYRAGQQSGIIPANLPSEAQTLRFERFVAWWFIGGIIPLCIAPHQRSDLLIPLIPPAAILAGLELSRWVARWRPRTRAAALACVCAVALGLMAWKYDFQARSAPPVAMTEAVRNLVQSIDAEAGANFPLTYADVPYALQFDRGAMQPMVSSRIAVELLGGDDAAFVAVCDLQPLQSEMGTDKGHDLISWPLHARTRMHVISNRPALKAEDRMAVAVGELIVHTQGLRWISAGESEFILEGRGQVRIVNRSSKDRAVTLRVGGTSNTHTVPAGQTWQCSVP